MKQRIKSYLWELFINGIITSRFIGCAFRGFVLRLVGCKIDKHSAVHSGCFISGKNLILSSNSYINRNCLIDCYHSNIEIGSNVGIAYDVRIFTTLHDYSNPKKRTGPVIGKPVVIQDGSWIGGDTTICPGVTIGEGCVIAAGSVVIHNCEPNALYAGVPAKKIKDLS